LGAVAVDHRWRNAGGIERDADPGGSGVSDEIDWSKPITAGFMGRPLWGDAVVDQPSGRLAGVREEQIRRAKLLITAAGGRPLTKGTVRRTVSRIAGQVPGLRYKFGALIHSGLAPPTSLFGDNLPGRETGRPGEWTADRRRLLLAQVDAIKEAAGNSQTDIAALKALAKQWRVERRYPPSVKVLQNQLSLAKAGGKRAV